MAITIAPDSPWFRFYEKAFALAEVVREREAKAKAEAQVREVQDRKPKK